VVSARDGIAVFSVPRAATRVFCVIFGKVIVLPVAGKPTVPVRGIK
jgi:ribosomal protein S27E